MVKYLLNLFFPKVCLACKYALGDNEKYICTNCRHQLPITNFHFENNNSVKKILFGRVDLINATSMFHFTKKGIVQELMHNLKYRGHEEIGTFLGQWLGKELAQLENYSDIDIVIPVPLHKSRLRKRGYNQVSKFGMEIAKALGIEYNDILLKRTFASKTQVFKDRIGRSNDDQTKFSMSKVGYLQGKHILLVDDIITTGATIEACADVLKEEGNIKLSLATMAITD